MTHESIRCATKVSCAGVARVSKSLNRFPETENSGMSNYRAFSLGRDSAMGESGDESSSLSDLNRLQEEKDELLRLFNNMKAFCERDGGLLEEELQRAFPEELSELPVIFNRQRTELNQLKIAVQVLRDLTTDDERDIQVFENVWKCILPYFSRNEITPEAEALLETFLTHLFPLLSAPRVADVIEKYFDQLVDLPYPDALIELCRNSGFATKIHEYVVRRFIETLKELDLQCATATARIPIDCEGKWRCVRLGNLIVDLARTSTIENQSLNSQILGELAETEVNSKEITVSFYKTKALQLLRSKCTINGNRSKSERENEPHSGIKLKAPEKRQNRKNSTQR